MLKKIVLLLLLILLAFAGYVAMQPSTGTVTRSATIAAPPATVFQYINDLHKWRTGRPGRSSTPTPKRRSKALNQASVRLSGGQVIVKSAKAK